MDPSFFKIQMVRDRKGVTLIELLVAVAITGLLMLGVIAAFQTTQRAAAIGEAREHMYQNARVALDLMAREIKSAHIDSRNRDLVFVSADGMAGRGNSILEYDPAAPANPSSWVLGLGNAQTPHGINPTGATILGVGTDVFYFYADRGFGLPTYTALTLKALDANGYPVVGLPSGPPDRLDFACMTGNFPGNTAGSESKLCEVRYIVTTETFVDAADNDFDGSADSADDDPPTGGGGLPGLGDMIAMENKDDYHPQTLKIKGLSLFQLRRGIDATPDNNPFSAFAMATGDGTVTDPQGRYPSRDFLDFQVANNGENIGSYIYDLQFEFYGRIAIALDSAGQPNTWGVGWGYQDVRGEDTGVIAIGSEGAGGDAIDDGNGVYTEGAGFRRILGDTTTWNSLNQIGGGTVDLTGGLFFVLPAGSNEFTEFDVADPANVVYKITNVISDLEIEIDRPYAGAAIPMASPLPYRIIEPKQANGILDKIGTAYPEDLGADGIVNDPLDDGTSNIPNNVSDNDTVLAAPELSIGEGNGRLDSRVMGIWDSRSPDPRNPRRATELNGQDDDGDWGVLQANGLDDDSDGQADDSAGDFTTPEGTATFSDANDLMNDDTDNIIDDRFYEPSGRAEGVDESDEANINTTTGLPHYDDTLPKAVRITIAVTDPQQAIDPVMLSTTVWLSTAK